MKHYTEKSVSRFTSAYLCLLLSMIWLCPTAMMADGIGIPFFKNFSASTYDAHNRNFDVACDDFGTVFIANFEGLLYYDGTQWREIYTPGISRVTRLLKDNDTGRIWVGGYNVFGYLEADKHGCLHLKTIVSDATNKGELSEVDFIMKKDKTIYVHTVNGKAYRVKDDKKLVQIKSNIDELFDKALSDTRTRTLPYGLSVSYNHTDGLEFKNNGRSIRLSEADGLISNSTNFVNTTKSSLIWGVTDNGLYCVEAVSPYTQLTERQGLKGEVNCVHQIGETIFIGTMRGIYAFRDGKLVHMDGTDLSCWQFYPTGKTSAVAATSDGLIRITENSQERLSTANTLSVCTMGNGTYLTGEIDGIYAIYNGGTRKRISPLEKATKLRLERNIIKAETIYGQLWEIPMDGSKSRCIRKKRPVDEPKIKTKDMFGVLWSTDAEGKNLKVESKSTNYDKRLKPWIQPLGKRSLNTIYVTSDGNVWAGGDFGVIILTGELIGKIQIRKPMKPIIRSIVITGDSVVWGGYQKDGLKPKTDISDLEFDSECHHITVNFSARNASIISPTEYRYRLNGKTWSQWSTSTQANFSNLMFGKFDLEVQARDLFGRLSEISKVSAYITPPFYMRWWAMVFYLMLIIWLIATIMRRRTKRLEAEKQKLEAIVTERTSELAKSNSQLSLTLEDLKRTQDDLVRMERTATAGKLTQGLIDRILNPINYINNFSKLTSGLAKDLKEDIEDEADKMSEDNYEDCQDILDMMSTNLAKIEEHGVNTTRTLRAMEAILNNRIGTVHNQDITSICRNAVNVTAEYHKRDIEQYHIDMSLDVPGHPVMHEVDNEATNKILMSMLTNSIYAVIKKYKQAPYNPIVKLQLTEAEDSVVIVVEDNGIGIEDTIKDKVFDPFFTTKTTGEAAGVGLYLVRELVNEQKGKITLDSEKDNYCKFTITLKK